MTITEAERCWQNYEAVKKIVDRFEVRRFAIPLQIQVQIPGDAYLIPVELFMRTMNRDTGAPMEIRQRQNGLELLTQRRDNEGTEFTLLRRWVRELVLHEFDECCYVDGVRRWDPHNDHL